MNKPNPFLRERNQEVRSLYWQHLRRGLPCMQAYAQVAAMFQLSEDRVREIVANIKCS